MTPWGPDLARGIVDGVTTATERTILVATDADEVLDEVDAALSDSTTQVVRVTAGRDVLGAIDLVDPDLVVLDLQIGSMGGVATALAIRNEVSAGRIEARPILMLLDRVSDVYLATRAEADGWLIKPLDALRLRRAADEVLDGGFYEETLAS